MQLGSRLGRFRLPGEVVGCEKEFYAVLGLSKVALATSCVLEFGLVTHLAGMSHGGWKLFRSMVYRLEI